MQFFLDFFHLLILLDVGTTCYDDAVVVEDLPGMMADAKTTNYPNPHGHNEQREWKYRTVDPDMTLLVTVVAFDVSCRLTRLVGVSFLVSTQPYL